MASFFLWEKMWFFIFNHFPLHDNLSIFTLNNDVIPVVRTIKVPGVTFDQRLSWNAHISNLCNKIAKAFKLLSSNKLNFRLTTLVRLYKALARSKVDYGAVVFSSASKTQKERVEVAQR